MRKIISMLALFSLNTQDIALKINQTDSEKSKQIGLEKFDKVKFSQKDIENDDLYHDLLSKEKIIFIETSEGNESGYKTSE